MRRSVLILAVVAAVVLGGALDGKGAAQVLPPPLAPPPLLEGATAPLTQTLVGELVDAACYATRGSDGGKGASHASCAIACARKGHRVALVTATGEVYMVTGALARDDNARLIPLMARTVVMIGEVREVTVQDGDVQNSAAPNGDAPSSATNGVTLESGVLTADKDKDRGDGRRPTGSEEGVVSKKKPKKGDFREGDVMDGTVRIIDPISVVLAPLGIQ